MLLSSASRSGVSICSTVGNPLLKLNKGSAQVNGNIIIYIYFYSQET